MQNTKRRNTAKSIWFLVRLVAICIIVAGVIWVATDRMGRIATLDAETAVVTAQIDAQLHIQSQLEDEENFFQNPAFIEDVARRFLNLVHRDEIIFNMVD